MLPESRARLWHAREAANAVVRLVDGYDWEKFQKDDVTRWAVERQLTIVGEALSQVRQADPAAA